MKTLAVSPNRIIVFEMNINRTKDIFDVMTNICLREKLDTQITAWYSFFTFWLAFSYGNIKKQYLT